MRKPQIVVFRLLALFSLAAAAGCSSDQRAPSAGVQSHDTARIGLSSHISYRRVVEADHPIAYWRLDEQQGRIAHDSSKNHVSGRIGAHVRIAQPPLIKDAARSMAFLGADKTRAPEDVRVPKNPLFERTTGISYETWVQPYTVNIHGHNTGDITLLSYGDDLNPDNQHCRWEVGLDAHSHVFNMQMVIYGRPTDSVGPHPRALALRLWDRLTGRKRLAREFYASPGSAGNPPQPNHVYQLVGTYDGKTITMYINGVYNNSLAVEGKIDGYSARDGLSIGGEYADVNPVFFGRISEVSVYDYTLSPQRVLAHYCAAQPAASVCGNRTGTVTPRHRTAFSAALR